MNQQQAYKLTEEEFQRMVIEVAHAYKWVVAHFRKARTLRGWVTPVQADGKGWPDLVLVKQSRIIFAELKSEKGKLTPEQQVWIDLLSNVGDKDVQVYIWRPSQWEQLVEILK